MYIAPLLSKVITDNQTSFEYVYNDSNLVTQEKSKFDVAMHHYNAKGLLASTVHYGNDDILSSDIHGCTNSIEQSGYGYP